MFKNINVYNQFGAAVLTALTVNLVMCLFVIAIRFYRKIDRLYLGSENIDQEGIILLLGCCCIASIVFAPIVFAFTLITYESKYLQDLVEWRTSLGVWVTFMLWSIIVYKCKCIFESDLMDKVIAATFVHLFNLQLANLKKRSNRQKNNLDDITGRFIKRANENLSAHQQEAHIKSYNDFSNAKKS